MFGPDTTVYATGVALGDGAYGGVVEVQHQGKKYAAKRFHSENASGVIGQEHEILATIRHENIVPYYGMCKLAPSHVPVLVMERLEMDLSVYLADERNKGLNLKRKFSILKDISQGLNHMHTHSPVIIHRDLMARNVLLDSRGTAKICDFGNSRIVSLNVALQQLSGEAIAGTLNYMPPEAHEGGECDEKLDIFSFGHLAVYVLIQHPPHPLLAPTYTDKGEHRARSEVDRRSKYLEEVKSHLDTGDRHPFFDLLIRCLHDDPAERPSCFDLLEILCHYEQILPTE
jgi:serine/threonine protein kinase